MLDWKTAIICMVLTLGAVLVSSLIKIIVTKIIEKKQTTQAAVNDTSNVTSVDKSKFEYPLAAISLALAFASVSLFLRYYVKIESDGTVLRYAAMYACTVNTIYLFIVQLARKGIRGVIKSLTNIFIKLKNSKSPVEEAPTIINEELSNVIDNTSNEQSDPKTSEQDEKLNALVKSFSDTLKK